MQTLTLEPEFEQDNSTTVEELMQNWRVRLMFDCPEQSATTRESIIRALLGLEQLESLNASQMEIIQKGMVYRYNILRQRYLGRSPGQAYRNLITRLGSLVVLRHKIRSWVDMSRDRSSTVVDILQEVIQELLQSDRYMQQQITWIAQCTSDPRLRNVLLLTSTEEYCLRPIRNQPLLAYRFVNYMRRNCKAGVTHVPKNELILLAFEEIPSEDNESKFSLLDTQAIAQYQIQQEMIEQKMLRNEVKQELSRYLAQKLGHSAVKWLELYLQGHSQQAIASVLNLPVQEVYRLREKISYHAVRVFTQKYHSQLVASLNT